MTLTACPRCQSPAWTECAHCGATYPVLDGIPFLIKNADAFLLRWGARLAMRLRQVSELERLAAGEPEGVRLRRVADSERSNLSRLLELIPEFAGRAGALGAAGGDPALSAGFLLPHTQHLESYWETVFRDWCWGRAEVDEAAEWVGGHLPSGEIQVAVLGSGAGGMIHALARRRLEARWWALDINPALLQCHRRMLAFADTRVELQLDEIPLNPRSLSEATVTRALRGEEQSSVARRITLLGADALQPCFRTSSLDAVVASWFVDIIPEDASHLARRVNRILKAEGVWLVHGPQGFSNPRSARAYTDEEFLEVLSAAGFEVLHHERRDQPYLHSPAGRQKRTELISLFVARKIRSCQAPPAHQDLPPYLLNRDQPVVADERIREMALDAATRAQILAAVDGKRSFEDLAGLIAAHYRISSQSARSLLIQVLAG